MNLSLRQRPRPAQSPFLRRQWNVDKCDLHGCTSHRHILPDNAESIRELGGRPRSVRSVRAAALSRNLCRRVVIAARLLSNAPAETAAAVSITSLLEAHEPMECPCGGQMAMGLKSLIERRPFDSMPPHG